MDLDERNRRALARAENARIDPPDEDAPECPECGGGNIVVERNRRGRVDSIECQECGWGQERDFEAEAEARAEARMSERDEW